jgi:phosphotransacetylase
MKVKFKPALTFGKVTANSVVELRKIVFPESTSERVVTAVKVLGLTRKFLNCVALIDLKNQVYNPISSD